MPTHGPVVVKHKRFQLSFHGISSRIDHAGQLVACGRPPIVAISVAGWQQPGEHCPRPGGLVAVGACIVCICFRCLRLLRHHSVGCSC